jgi:hypothetical protein
MLCVWHALCPLRPPPQKNPYENGKMNIEDMKGKWWKKERRNPKPIVKTKYIEYQITSQILHGIKGYTFLVLLQYVKVFQQNLFITLCYTSQVRFTHKFILNFLGTTFGYVLKAFNIFMVMVPHHSVKISSFCALSRVRNDFFQIVT